MLCHPCGAVSAFGTDEEDRGFAMVYHRVPGYHHEWAYIPPSHDQPMWEDDRGPCGLFYPVYALFPWEA